MSLWVQSDTVMFGLQGQWLHGSELAQRPLHYEYHEWWEWNGSSLLFQAQGNVEVEGPHSLCCLKYEIGIHIAQNDGQKSLPIFHDILMFITIGIHFTMSVILPSQFAKLVAGSTYHWGVKPACNKWACISGPETTTTTSAALVNPFITLLPFGYCHFMGNIVIVQHSSQVF